MGISNRMKQIIDKEILIYVSEVLGKEKDLVYWVKEDFKIGSNINI